MSQWPRGQKLYEHGLLLAHRTTPVDGQPAELWELVATYRTDKTMREMFVDAAAFARVRRSELLPRLVELEPTCFVVTGPPWVALETVRKTAGRLPPNVVVTIVRDLAHQLAEHADLLLRSLSPRTIAITTTGRVRLLDLTTARYKGRAGRPTANGVLKGEMPYMSPEATVGRHLDARADVFSLGAVAFELLVGTRAFSASTPMETLLRIRNGKIDSIDELGRMHGAALEGLILRMTLLSRDERRGWSELVQTIERDLPTHLLTPEPLFDELRRLAPAAVDEAVLYAY